MEIVISNIKAILKYTQNVIKKLQDWYLATIKVVMLEFITVIDNNSKNINKNKVGKLVLELALEDHVYPTFDFLSDKNNGDML